MTKEHLKKKSFLDINYKRWYIQRNFKITQHKYTYYPLNVILLLNLLYQRIKLILSNSDYYGIINTENNTLSITTAKIFFQST